MATTTHEINCPTVKKLVLVYRSTFGGVSGTGDEYSAPHVDYSCEHEETCPPDGNPQSCPVRRKNLASG